MLQYTLLFAAWHIADLPITFEMLKSPSTLSHSLCVCSWVFLWWPVCFDDFRWGNNRRQRGSATLSALHGLHPGARRRESETRVWRVCDCRSVGDDCNTLSTIRVRQPAYNHDECGLLCGREKVKDDEWCFPYDIYILLFIQLSWTISWTTLHN